MVDFRDSMFSNADTEQIARDERLSVDDAIKTGNRYKIFLGDICLGLKERI